MNGNSTRSKTSVGSGNGGLPKVTLRSEDGAQAEVYLHGAHVTSWIPAGGSERLFLSRTSLFNAGAAIRGGVPVIFPQFGGRGPLPKHGFARHMDWKLVEAPPELDAATAAFQLSDTEATRKIWPHGFNVVLGVTVRASQLNLKLSVTNSGADDFTFTGALHTYLRVGDITRTVIEGLAGQSYLDSTAGEREQRQEDAVLSFSGEVDRVYLNAPSRLTLREPDRLLTVENSGFPDAVIWNPWIEKGAALTDLEPDGYRRMVSVEAALVGKPVTLRPGESWNGMQQLTAN